MRYVWWNVKWFLGLSGWWPRSYTSTGLLHLWRFYRWGGPHYGRWGCIIEWNFLRRYELLTICGRYEEAGRFHRANLLRLGHDV